ncbi:hypothetical protein SERLADRAFT_432446 [Serpula lacrymans var. lacrymans S7.9]|uniref:Uncharacterized protein n=1 Tax=Serpula lacrymans var. lacrymans (strain S7.9) TaxID=578457 RepID=F8NF95_SERL9|nr:uncharacterized protein SERLADRAFT_432446 [Serpula lacrymans var. lacrymans S7.9]EGO30809.1 hypothetical protein SERLADRAFT_432446 [Serpula lacrymans var. lacrymans S7.9]
MSVNNDNAAEPGSNTSKLPGTPHGPGKQKSLETEEYGTYMDEFEVSSTAFPPQQGHKRAHNLAPSDIAW